jgi:hypothetical protein
MTLGTKRDLVAIFIPEGVLHFLNKRDLYGLQHNIF